MTNFHICFEYCTNSPLGGLVLASLGNYLDRQKCQTELRTGAAVCGVTAVQFVEFTLVTVQYSTLECNTVHWSAIQNTGVQENTMKFNAM